jgi:hypothetical protein
MSLQVYTTGIGEVNLTMSAALHDALIWARTHQEDIVQLLKVRCETQVMVPALVADVEVACTHGCAINAEGDGGSCRADSGSSTHALHQAPPLGRRGCSARTRRSPRDPRQVVRPTHSPANV